jgi:hypothetical protein
MKLVLAVSHGGHLVLSSNQNELLYDKKVVLIPLL